jgi:hypothetical protein
MAALRFFPIAGIATIAAFSALSLRAQNAHA